MVEILEIILNNYSVSGAKYSMDFEEIIDFLMPI